MLNIKYPSDYFDCVYSVEAIEHAVNIDHAIKEMVRILKPKGKIIIITPNSDSTIMGLFKKYCDGINAPRHIYIFSPSAMEILKKKMGFKKITFFPNPDLMQWNLSLQNVCQNIPFLRTRLKNGVAWYTIFLSIVFLPISLFTSFGKKTAVMLCVLE